MARINAYSLALLLFCYVLSGAAEAGVQCRRFRSEARRPDGLVRRVRQCLVRRLPVTGAGDRARAERALPAQPCGLHWTMLQQGDASGRWYACCAIRLHQRRGRRLDRVRPRRRPHCVGRHRRRPRRGAVGVQGSRARRLPQWSNSELAYNTLHASLFFLQKFTFKC